MNRRDLVQTLTAAAVPSWSYAAARANAAGDSAGAAFLASRRYVHLPSGRIAYGERGQAGPTVIFLHGWPLNGYQWRGAMAELAGHARCLAPDFLGLGDTDAPANSDLSPGAQARMIGSFMDHLGIREAHLVANDSGTAVAQLVAVRHPDRIRSLLLTNGDVDTHSPPPVLEPALQAASRGELAGMIERHLTEPGFAQSPEGLGAICYTDPAHLTRESMEVYFRPLLATPLKRLQFQAYGVAFKPTPLPAIAERLAMLEIPTRMLWGTGDVHFPRSCAEWLDRTIPASRGIHWVEGGKLFFPEERPDLVAAETRALLETS